MRIPTSLSLLAKIGLTVLAFWFVLRDIEPGEVVRMVQAQTHSALMVAALLLMAQIALGAVRWRLIVRALSPAGQRVIGWAGAGRLYYISVFFNCCLPGTVGGDVIRVWLAKAQHMPLSLALSSVVIERLVALLALGLLGMATLPVLAGYVDVSLWVLWPPLLLLAGAGVWALCMADRLLARAGVARVPHWLSHFSQSVRLLLARPKTAAWSLCYGLLAHVCYCLCACVLADSLGATLSLLDALALVPWVLLLSMVPLSIGGWGLREAGMVFMLAFAGVPQAAALALSMQLGLLYIVICLPAGALWLMRKKHDIAF